MKKKNIIIKNGTLTMGGGEKVLVNILKNLNLNKYNITLLIDDDSGEENIFLEDIPKGIKVFFLRPLNWVKKVREYYEKKNKNIIEKIFYNYYLWKNVEISKNKCIKYVEKLKKESGDIDLFIDFNGNARKYIDKLNVRKKIIWRHLSMAEYSNNQKKIQRYGNYAENYDIIIVICNNLKKEMINLLPNLEKKIKVAYNPIDFSENLEKSLTIEDLNEKERKLMEKDYILTVSRLDREKKDYKTLIEGYKLAKEKSFFHKLYIVGEGFGRSYIEKMIKDNNLENDIFLLGEKKNPYIWMKYCKFFVLSSKEEGFGLVLAEAMGLKKAVISSDCPVGPSEILEEGKSGLLFPVGDKERLMLQLMELQKKPDILMELEEKGYKRVKEFDMKNTIFKYEEIFDEIMER